MSLSSHKAPEFICDAISPSGQGEIRLSDFLGRWVILYFHPTSLFQECSDLLALNERISELRALNVHCLCVNTESVYATLAWISTSSVKGGLGSSSLKLPIVCDYQKSICKDYGIQIGSLSNTERTFFLISPTGIIRHQTSNDVSVGFNVEELIRLVNECQSNDQSGGAKCSILAPSKQSLSSSPSPPLPSSSSISDVHTNSNANTDADTNAGNGISRVRFSPLTPIQRMNPTTTNSEPVLTAISPSSSLSNNNETIQPQLINFLRFDQIKSLYTFTKEMYSVELIQNPIRTKALTSCLLAIIGEILRVQLVKKFRIFENIKSMIFKNYSRSYNSEISYNISSEGNNNVLLRNVAINGAFGFMSGIAFHYWYVLLDNIIMSTIQNDNNNDDTRNGDGNGNGNDNEVRDRESMNRNAKLRVVLRNIINQFLFTPTFQLFTLGFLDYLRNTTSISSLLSSSSLSSSSSTNQSFATFRDRYITSLIKQWKLLSLLQAINLGFSIQRQHQQQHENGNKNKNRNDWSSDSIKLFWNIFLGDSLISNQ